VNCRYFVVVLNRRLRSGGKVGGLVKKSEDKMFIKKRILSLLVHSKNVHRGILVSAVTSTRKNRGLYQKKAVAVSSR